MWTFLQSLIEVWNGWEIRALILLSLKLQIILIAFGSKRKVTRNIWVKILVWSAYMSADWVATVALGILAKGDSGKTEHPLETFWAPFLLLHLGGPDTITAYSLEDNQLWHRHLLGLVVETGVAFYVFLRSSDDTVLTLIAIPVFIAGIIKYGERTWVLRSSSSKNFRDSLLSEPDPGPDYIKIYEENLKEKKASGVDKDLLLTPKKALPQRYSGSPYDHLSQAYYLLNRVKYLFADLILGYYERKDCHSMINDVKSSKEAFELVEGELGFLYDMLYTKATIIYTRWGFLIRCISFFSSVSALITFAIFIDEHAYSTIDISITYSLLIGAVALEVYALVLVILSDWSKLWFASFLEKVGIGKRWSRTISKYNLIKFCLRKNSTLWIRVQKLLGVYEILEKHLNVDCQVVDSELQDLIFQQLKERSENINSLFDINACKKLLNYRGDWVLEKMDCIESFKWCTIDVEFDHSLLLWHIATQLCYYDDIKNNISSDGYSKISLCLSDYMLYLLVMCPNMLPEGIGEIRYRDTCAEATRFFKQRRGIIGSKVDEACHELYGVDTELLEKVKGDQTKSVLFYGCRLAKQLQSLVNRYGWDCKGKWKMMNVVWVELLGYAAVQCGWKEHGQQLRNGGELLTHVRLVMTHFGLSDQYQIQKEYFHIREGMVLHCPHACDPCLLPLLFLCLTPYWCSRLFQRNSSPSRDNIYSKNIESIFSF